MADYRISGEWLKDDMVLLKIARPETIDQIESLDMKEGDVLIVGYPKTGKTWIVISV